jgi:hypothetical protein
MTIRYIAWILTTAILATGLCLAVFGNAWAPLVFA